MRSLREWYVNFDSIKTDAKTYERYLLSKSRHPRQEIKCVSKNSTIDLEIDLMKYNQFLENPENYYTALDKNGNSIQKKKRRAQKNWYECTISLPEDLKDIDKIDWGVFYKKVLKDYFEWLEVEMGVELDIEHLVSVSYVVQHRKDHIHIILPTLDLKTMSYIDHSHKKSAYITKQFVNKNLREMYDIDKEKYLVDQSEVRQQKKSMKTTRTEKMYKKFEQLKDTEKIQQKNKKYLDVKFSELEDLKEELNDTLLRISLMYQKVQETLSTKDKDKIEKQISTAEKQINKGNTQRAQKTMNNIQDRLKSQNPKM